MFHSVVGDECGSSEVGRQSPPGGYPCMGPRGNASSGHLSVSSAWSCSEGLAQRRAANDEPWRPCLAAKLLQRALGWHQHISTLPLRSQGNHEHIRAVGFGGFRCGCLRLYPGAQQSHAGDFAGIQRKHSGRIDKQSAVTTGTRVTTRTRAGSKSGGGRSSRWRWCCR